jgi:hypothetical protein
MKDTFDEAKENNIEELSSQKNSIDDAYDNFQKKYG